MPIAGAGESAGVSRRRETPVRSVTRGKPTAPCMLRACNRDFPVRRSRRPPVLRHRPPSCSRRPRFQARECLCSRLVLSLAERCRPSAISERISAGPAAAGVIRTALVHGAAQGARPRVDPGTAGLGTPRLRNASTCVPKASSLWNGVRPEVTLEPSRNDAPRRRTNRRWLGGSIESWPGASFPHDRVAPIPNGRPTPAKRIPRSSPRRAPCSRRKGNRRV